MTLDGQVEEIGPNHGRLIVEVWPTYIGIGESTDGGVTLLEQADHPDYQRGQIEWRTQPDGRIVGRARVALPKGIYTHLMFCHGPRDHLISVEQFEHPVVFDRPGFFDVDPIENTD